VNAHPDQTASKPPLPADVDPEASPPELDGDYQDMNDDHGTGGGEFNVGMAERGARGTGADANLI
jgi:hypothetical protein